MPVYELPEEHLFPPPEDAEPGGLLAVGGDLSPRRILTAYCMGIFPWFSEGDPIMWWSPDPRLVLEPGQMKLSQSLRRVLKKGQFRVTMDAAFEAVMRGCAEMRRKGESGTWIVEEMITAYTALHTAGFAHSVEAWRGDELAGGLYGVCIGGVFFGESMFSRATDASKVALAHLVAALKSWGIGLIDCQVTTGHLLSIGAREIPRREFLERLGAALETETRRGAWTLPEGLQPY